jgi:hypothetical protein
MEDAGTPRATRYGRVAFTLSFWSWVVRAAGPDEQFMATVSDTCSAAASIVAAIVISCRRSGIGLLLENGDKDMISTVAL